MPAGGRGKDEKSMAEGKSLTQRQIQGKISVIDAKVDKYRGYIAKLNAEKKKLAAQKKKLAAAAAKAKDAPAKPKARPASKDRTPGRKPAAGNRTSKSKKGAKPEHDGSVLQGILAEVKKSGIGVDDIIASLTGK
jgi:hypothetical protein